MTLAANAFTSTELLASMKRRGLIPTAASAFAASDFFKIVDDETQTYIVPLLMSVREEYLVAFEEFDIVDEVDPDTGGYALPERAIGQKIRQLSVGTTFDGPASDFRPLTRVEPGTTTDQAGYYLQGSQIFLTGTGLTGVLRIHYFQRPNRVVATSAVARILTVNSNTVTFESDAPDTFETTSASNFLWYDIVKGYSSFDLAGKVLTGTVLSPTSMSFSTLPDITGTGDYVCIQQETPIPQIPLELHPLLAQRVTATVLQALGDEKAAVAYKVADDMEKRILRLLAPRTEGSARYVVNRFGVGRRGPTYYRGR